MACQVPPAVHERALPFTVFLALAVCTAFLAALPLQAFAAEPVTIAVVPGEISGLVYLARDKGFFLDEGFDVRLEEHEVDYEAVNSMLRGKAHFATASEFVVARKVLLGEELKILSALCRADVYRIVVRRSEIEGPRDLRGKRIGIRYASIAEFYLSRFLLFNGLSSEEVQVREMPMRKAGQALASQTIDAVFLMAGSIPRLLDVIPEQDLVVHPAQQGIDLYWLLAARPELTVEPERSRSLLRALVRAEEFIEKQPREAYALLRTSLGLRESKEELYTFRVTLEQSMLLTMEDEARWILARQLDPQRRLPNFLEAIHFDALKSVKPEAVNIIH